MKCEFVRDENNNVWLSYIKGIQMRRIYARFTLQNCDVKPIGGPEAMLAHQTQK